VEAQPRVLQMQLLSVLKPFLYLAVPQRLRQVVLPRLSKVLARPLQLRLQLRNVPERLRIVVSVTWGK
jgi:hypothetical protein